MVTKKDIEKPRSPRGLRQFVRYRIERVRQVTNERHAAMRRRGIYKVFSDEIIPLSIFALKIYPNTYRVKPVLGNQGYDAIIMSAPDRIADYVELTWPQNGKWKAKDAELTILRGCGNVDMYLPGEDIDRLCNYIQSTCLRKAQKDYSNCTVVVIIDFVPPLREHRLLYSRKLRQLAEEMKSIPFKAKRVFLLILPFQRVLKVSA